MRSQRLVWPDSPADGGQVAETTTTVTLPPHGRFDPFPFAIGLRLPEVTHALQEHDDGSRTLWLYSLGDPAWASVTFRDGEQVHRVRRYGARQLWDEFAAAYAWRLLNGRPGIDRFGLTVTAGGQRVWLDEPGNTVRHLP
ncbi:hypothetical protein [Kitasatospora sp. HPMI-4]|uniref:hypothetical protein n=1 Tax=Kitasatospora sp. HPMI-4 TaxID=3448443 RepID=UPI003F1BB9D0